MRSTHASDLLRSRRTVPVPCLDLGRGVDVELVRSAVESARWAPNHHRTEPWRFVILDRARIVRLGELFAQTLERGGSPATKVEAKRREWGSAPGVLVLTCVSDADADATRRREDYAACCSAAQNLMLHLWAQGIGSKWSTGAVWEHEEFWDLLGAPNARGDVVGVFFYGWPERVPEGRRRLGLDDVLVDHVGGAGS